MVTHRGISGYTGSLKKHPQSQLRTSLQSFDFFPISFISYISFIGALSPCLTTGAMLYILKERNQNQKTVKNKRKTSLYSGSSQFVRNKSRDFIFN